MTVVGGDVDPATVYSSLWTQAQQFEHVMEQTQPLPQQHHELQQLPPAESVSTFVAMVHCLGTLEHSFTGSGTAASQAQCWKPGRRDYRLLANMMLRGLQCVEAKPCGASPWTTLLPMVIEAFLLSYNRSSRKPALEDTAGLAAAALLTGAWRLIARLPSPEDAPDVPSLVIMGDIVTHAVSHAVMILTRLRCAAVHFPCALKAGRPDPWCYKQILKRMLLSCDDQQICFCVCRPMSSIYEHDCIVHGPRQQSLSQAGLRLVQSKPAQVAVPLCVLVHSRAARFIVNRPSAEACSCRWRESIC